MAGVTSTGLLFWPGFGVWALPSTLMDSGHLAAEPLGMAQAVPPRGVTGRRPDAEGDHEPEGHDDMDGWVRERAVIYQPHPPREPGHRHPPFWVDVNREVRVWIFEFIPSTALLPLAGPLHRELTLQPSCFFLALQPQNCPNLGSLVPAPKVPRATKPMSARQNSIYSSLVMGIHTKAFFPGTPYLLRWPSGAPGSFGHCLLARGKAGQRQRLSAARKGITPLCGQPAPSVVATSSSVMGCIGHGGSQHRPGTCQGQGGDRRDAGDVWCGLLVRHDLPGAPVVGSLP